MIAVTMGDKGSAALFDDEFVTASVTPVTPVDTTGAGDAFWGTFLSMICMRLVNKENVITALREGNKKGSAATMYHGALKKV